MTTTSVEALKEFLESTAVPDECYDYIQLHGFLTALAICPEEIARDEWLPEVFAGEPDYDDEAEQQMIEATIEQMLNSIKRILYSGEILGLPVALNLGRQPEQSPLCGWAIGFMEGVALRETTWFDEHEEEIGDLMLPIMLASGLFDDPELDTITHDQKQMKVLLARIPNNLSEMYLLFRDSDNDADEK